MSLEDWNPGTYFWLMNPSRDEEIAASVGAHRDLGPAYDDAVAAGLVERNRCSARSKPARS
jgi:hypothetical protein